MNSRYFGNCCKKGQRACVPYTSKWPESQWFGPVDQRQDQWHRALDPTRYAQGRYVCYKDDHNWACVDTATSSYLQQQQFIDRSGGKCSECEL